LRPNLSVKIPNMGVAISSPAAYMANSTPTWRGTHTHTHTLLVRRVDSGARSDEGGEQYLNGGDVEDLGHEDGDHHAVDQHVREDGDAHDK
jgi:hypothetical protein